MTILLYIVDVFLNLCYWYNYLQASEAIEVLSGVEI